jgi:integrase
LHELVGGEPIKRLSLREFATSWLANKEHECSPSTHVFYSGSVKRLIRALGPRADLPIGEITTADLTIYRNALADELAARSTNHNLKVAKMLLRAAKRDCVIADDPAEFLAIVKEANGSASTPRRAFTLDEIRAVLAVADPEWRSLVLFGLYQGREPSSACPQRALVPLSSPHRNHVAP